MVDVSINKKGNCVSYVEIRKDSFGSLRRDVIDKIVDAGLDSFGPGMQKDEILDHVFDSDRIYLAFSGSNVLGFGVATRRPDAVDLSGAAVRPGAQGLGVYQALTLRRINLALDCGLQVVTLRTQNPKVEKGVRSCLDDLVELGIIDSYRVDREINPGVYGRMLTSERPFCGVHEIDAYYNQLEYGSGDAFSLAFTLAYEKQVSAKSLNNAAASKGS